MVAPLAFTIIAMLLLLDIRRVIAVVVSSSEAALDKYHNMLAIRIEIQM